MKQAAWHKTVRARRASVQQMNAHKHAHTNAHKLLLSAWTPKQKTNERAREGKGEGHRRAAGTLSKLILALCRFNLVVSSPPPFTFIAARADSVRFALFNFPAKMEGANLIPPSFHSPIVRFRPDSRGKIEHPPPLSPTFTLFSGSVVVRFERRRGRR